MNARKYAENTKWYIASSGPFRILVLFLEITFHNAARIFTPGPNKQSLYSQEIRKALKEFSLFVLLCYTLLHVILRSTYLGIRKYTQNSDTVHTIWLA